jgi:hypothetical protein
MNLAKSLVDINASARRNGGSQAFMLEGKCAGKLKIAPRP